MQVLTCPSSLPVIGSTRQGRGCLIRTVSTEMIDLAQPAYEQPLTLATMLSLAEAGDIGLQRLLGDLGRGVGRPLADACTLLL